jgi:hypothetical protein
MVQNQNKNAAKTPVPASRAIPQWALRPGPLGLIRSGLARDVTLALLVKVVLLTGLIVAVSRLAIRTSDSAAATAQAVAGISGSGELAR